MTEHSVEPTAAVMEQMADELERGEEQQTFNNLTDAEIDECLEDLMEHGFHASVFDVFSQAKEANRLREGLERIRDHAIQMRDLNKVGYERTIDPEYSVAEGVYSGVVYDISELLEGA